MRKRHQYRSKISAEKKASSELVHIRIPAELLYQRETEPLSQAVGMLHIHSLFLCEKCSELGVPLSWGIVPIVS